ncbi:FUSC family protein [Peterkaempfera bronchialis]|uniref:FUSC family protein n=1 Tax=Peterkaempfera bronchialis TaxID=2126346 RepID=UPI003C2D937C
MIRPARARSVPWSAALRQSIRSGLRLERAVNSPTEAARGAVGVAAVLFPALAVGSPATATSAALGAFIAGTATFQRSFRPRPTLALGAAAALGASTFTGFAALTVPGLFTVVLGCWAFLAGLAWAFGPTAGVVAATSVSVMLVVVQLPVGLFGALVHAGVIALAGLVQAVLIMIWPVRPWGAQRDALADAYASVADYARRLRHDPVAPFDAVPLMVARTAAQLTRRQARRRPQELHGLRGLAERMLPLMAALADPRVGAAAEGPERDRAREMLAAAAQMLDALARAVRRGERLRVPPGVAGVLAAPSGGPALQGAARRAGSRLAALLGEAADAVDSPGDGGGGYLLQPSGLDMVRAAVHTVRSRLHWSSPVLRHAVRLAATVVVADLAGRLLGIPHSYWAALTAAVVLRPDFAQTFSRGVARVAGTVAGVAAATGVAAVSHPGPWACAVLAVAFVAAMYLTMRSGFAAASVFVSGYVVFLLAMSGTSLESTVRSRVELTLLGGALAMVAYVAFPAWETVRLPDRLAELTAACGRYAGAGVRAFGDPAGCDGSGVRSALLAVREARTALAAAEQRAAVEPVRQRGLGAERLSRAERALVALGRVAMLLEAHRPDRSAPPVPGAVEFAGALEATAAEAAAAVRAGQPLAVGGLREAYEAWQQQSQERDGEPGGQREALVHAGGRLAVEAMEELAAALEG